MEDVQRRVNENNNVEQDSMFISKGWSVLIVSLNPSIDGLSLLLERSQSGIFSGGCRLLIIVSHGCNVMSMPLLPAWASR